MESIIAMFRCGIILVIGFFTVFFSSGFDCHRIHAAEKRHAAEKQPLSPFLIKHCADCHHNGEKEGGFALSSLGTDLKDEQTLSEWVKLFDRVDRKEMPPRSSEQPRKTELKKYTTKLSNTLFAAHAAQKGTVLRRLNRQEYQNTLNDLFGTNLNLARRFPEDERSHEFDNVGKSLSLSMVQLQKYLESIDAVMEKSIATRSHPTPSKTIRASYAEGRDAKRFLGKYWLKRNDGAVVFFKQRGYPTGMLREAIASKAGFYKIRVTGYAYQTKKPVLFSIGSQTFVRGFEAPIYGFYSMPPGKPTTIEVTAWLEDRYMVVVKPWGIHDDNYELARIKLKDYRGAGLAIKHIEIEGPLIEQFPSKGHNFLFKGLHRKEIEPKNKSVKTKSWYHPKYELQIKNEKRQISRALLRIASTAFRRPVHQKEVASFVALYEKERKAGATKEKGLKTAVAAIFCSPNFLYLKEGSGKLDDYALANRLSYFLSRTAPDDALLKAAQKGELTKSSSALKKQVDRLIQDERFDRFVEDFTNAWLNLRDIDFTSPDKKLFPEYDFFLRDSMLQETRLFLKELVQKNMPARNIVKSDFTMLNSRLAKHYGIPGVNGPQMRRITLPKNSVRGGFLTQASILKVSANGTNTSPVVRGVWVVDRIMGMPPPPPPSGVPGVEPDIRGATTLREILEKHRTMDSCNSCHVIIDPPGFALESFNPIGGFRKEFRRLGKGEKVKASVNGIRVVYKRGLKVDSTGQFPDGEKFNGILQFKKSLAKREKLLATAFTTKILTFATGREMGFSDRKVIDQIVNDSAKNGYPIRDLILRSVQSEIFKSK